MEFRSIIIYKTAIVKENNLSYIGTNYVKLYLTINEVLDRLDNYGYIRCTDDSQKEYIIFKHQILQLQEL